MADQENKEEKVEQEKKVVHSGATAAPKKKRKKKVWTEASCKKVAGRYDSEESWKKGSPSSYKAAASHNWVKSCQVHQEWRQSEANPVSLPQSA